jgi:hypothetical protein
MSFLGNHRAHGDAEPMFDLPCAALFSLRAQNS